MQQAVKFCVNEKLVHDWRKQVEKLKCMLKNKCSNREKTCQWPKLEDKLLQWIEEQRQSGYIVTRNMIIIKAKAMAAELQIPVTRFLASNCWCTKFVRWKNLALRQKTKIVQKLPEDHKLPQLHHQKQKKKITNLFTSGTWTKRLSGLTCHQQTCHQPEP